MPSWRTYRQEEWSSGPTGGDGKSTQARARRVDGHTMGRSSWTRTSGGLGHPDGVEKVEAPDKGALWSSGQTAWLRWPRCPEQRRHHRS